MERTGVTVTPLLCHKTTSANAPGTEQDWGEEEGLKAMESAWHLIQAWLLQALGWHQMSVPPWWEC